MKSKKLTKFEELVSDEKSNWLEKALWRKTNKKWLDQSAKVALNVLEALSEKGWSQKRLAEEMKVSSQQINKIVKGKQNLTFETVAKIEVALNISLVQITDYRRESVVKKPVNIFAQQSIEEFKPIAKIPSPNFKYTPKAKLTIVYTKTGTGSDYRIPA